MLLDQTHKSMRIVDIHRYEVVVRFGRDIAGYAWIAHDKNTGKRWIEFTHKGWSMRWDISHGDYLRLNSLDRIISKKATEKVVNVISYFYYRVEDTLRGGYA